MKRTYQHTTIPTSEVKCFFGKEVEKTVAHGLETMFIVDDSMPLHQIASFINPEIEGRIYHVYLGANQSFNLKYMDYYKSVIEEFCGWGEMGNYHAPIYVTLDFPIDYQSLIQSYNFHEFHSFIAMISIRYTDATTMPYNTYIKIDDTTINGTNPGVWVHHAQSLLNKESFTPWSAYNNDQV